MICPTRFYCEQSHSTPGDVSPNGMLTNTAIRMPRRPAERAGLQGQRSPWWGRRGGFTSRYVKYSGSKVQDDCRKMTAVKFMNMTAAEWSRPQEQPASFPDPLPSFPRAARGLQEMGDLGGTVPWTVTVHTYGYLGTTVQARTYLVGVAQCLRGI